LYWFLICAKTSTFSRKIRARSGSKCFPLSVRKSSTIRSSSQAFLYGRSLARASKTSASAAMRAKMWICPPAMPQG